MDVVSRIICFGIFLSCTACQLPYYMKSAYHQLSLLSSREDIDSALKKGNFNEDEKRKIQLSQEAREFAEQQMHLKKTKNYTSFVQLPQPYVSYVVSAAPKWELKHHQWDFLVVGKLPYKGYFKEEDAQQEEQQLQKKNLDTYMRGVSAYSTLGWFKDPLLSSMLRYSDYDLVNLVIHETVHATLFIKGSADFNERLATFLGNKGSEIFYLQKEGKESSTLKKVRDLSEDDLLFSTFISGELKDLEDWYKNVEHQDEELRQQRIKQIQERFTEKIQPQLKTENYKRFAQRNLNNAVLNVYKTYMKDLSDFEKLWSKVGEDFNRFLEECKKLEKAKDPEQALKELL